MVKFQFKFN